MAQRRILVLLAHPAPDRSEISLPMADAAKSIDGVTLIDLYAEYPTFDIDVDAEQKRLVDHDVLLFLFPLYWYSTPSILKEWQDLVLEHGFAYGSEGKALHGKLFVSSLSAGGPAAAYRAEGYNHFTIRELLQPLEQTANLCGMVYLPPYALFGSRNAVEEGRLPAHVEGFAKLLVALRDDKLDIERAREAPVLDCKLDNLLIGD